MKEEKPTDPERTPARKKKTSSKTPGAKKRVPRRPDGDRPQRDPVNGQFLPGNSAAAKWSDRKVREFGQQILDWMHESPHNFWMRDFLLDNDMYDDVIKYLSDRHPVFKEYIARAKEIQASRIQKFGLMNQLNSGMVQWVLSVHHKLTQKTETEITHSRPLVVHIDERIARED